MQTHRLNLGNLFGKFNIFIVQWQCKSEIIAYDLSIRLEIFLGLPVPDKVTVPMSLAYSRPEVEVGLGDKFFPA